VDETKTPKRWAIVTGEGSSFGLYHERTGQEEGRGGKGAQCTDD